jgi:TetR/AcrR family transcriptional repressor of uid operon
MPDGSPDLLPRADTDGTHQDQRRAQILDAARQCFARSGFHGASMQQVCAEAKMSPGALYRYFPSKEAIIEAIAEDERSKAMTVMAAFHVEGSIVDRVTACGVAYMRLMQRPASGQLMVEICAESMRNTSVGDRFHCIETDIRGEFLAAFAAAQAAGEIPADVDLPVALQVLLSVGDGLVLRMGLEPDMTPEAVEPYLRRVVAGILHLDTSA